MSAVAGRGSQQHVVKRCAAHRCCSIGLCIHCIFLLVTLSACTCSSISACLVTSPSSCHSSEPQPGDTPRSSTAGCTTHRSLSWEIFLAGEAPLDNYRYADLCDGGLERNILEWNSVNNEHHWKITQKVLKDVSLGTCKDSKCAPPLCLLGPTAEPTGHTGGSLT